MDPLDKKPLAPPSNNGTAVRDDLDATTDNTGMRGVPPNYPPGMNNLGNTSYMNSILQCLRAVPELRTALNEFRRTTIALKPVEKLTAELRDLRSRMNSDNANSISPEQFWILLRQVIPQFSERSSQGAGMQQDAAECWDEILSCLATPLKTDSVGTRLHS